jgi:CO/xanthine dehydrogenase Mo-binding subunit
MAAEALDWWTTPEAGRGRAIGISASDAGSEPVATSLVRVHADGSLTVTVGSTEIGQGSSTVLAQIAAGELGLPLERVNLLQGDTAAVSYDRSTGASRTTTLMGLAIQRACADVREQLLGWAVEALAGGGHVEPAPGGVLVDGVRHDWGAVVRAWFGGAFGEVVGRGYVRRAGVTAQMPPFWEVGCVGVEVSVDGETGQVRVERLVTVGDVGRAINPQLVESQDLGAAVMGLGMALSEELIWTAEGNLLGSGLVDYRVPRASDIPEVTTLLAERADGIGVDGAKGGGEGSLNPVAAAVANAVRRAAGVRLREAPFTPERVWRAMRDQPRDRDRDG